MTISVEGRRKELHKGANFKLSVGYGKMIFQSNIVVLADFKEEVIDTVCGIFMVGR